MREAEETQDQAGVMAEMAVWVDVGTEPDREAKAATVVTEAVPGLAERAVMVV